MNINIVTTGGETALIKAAEQGSIEVCTALINAGADMNIKDSMGRTAQHYAKLNHPNNTDLRKLLGEDVEELMEGVEKARRNWN